MIGQELSPADWVWGIKGRNVTIATVPPTGILWSSDETHFHLSGTVIKQNFCYWAAENPPKLHAQPFHNPKVTCCVVYGHH